MVHKASNYSRSKVTVIYYGSFRTYAFFKNLHENKLVNVVLNIYLEKFYSGVAIFRKQNL